MGQGLSLAFETLLSLPFVCGVFNFFYFIFFKLCAHYPQGRMPIACLMCFLMIPKFVSLIETTHGLPFQPGIRASSTEHILRSLQRVSPEPPHSPHDQGKWIACARCLMIDKLELFGEKEKRNWWAEGVTKSQRTPCSLFSPPREQGSCSSAAVAVEPRLGEGFWMCRRLAVEGFYRSKTIPVC